MEKEKARYIQEIIRLLKGSDTDLIELIYQILLKASA